MRPPNALQKVLLISLLALVSAIHPRVVSAGINAWTSIGPEGGIIYALAIDRASPATLYAGTWSSGVFKSTNGGGSWTPANTGLIATTVRTVAVDPATPATLYAATGGHGAFVYSKQGITSNRSYLPMISKGPPLAPMCTI